MGDKKRILVVDDNASFVELAANIFSADHDVDTALDGAAGLEKAGKTVPDLILLDVNMPGMNGIEFARKLSARPETAAIPIIVLTASDYNSLTQSLLGKEPNVKSFMTKLTPIETIREKALAVIARG